MHPFDREKLNVIFYAALNALQDGEIFDDVVDSGIVTDNSLCNIREELQQFVDYGNGDSPACIARIREALHLTTSESGASVEYAGGAIVGVVSALLATGEIFYDCLNVIAENVPKNFREECIPESWRRQFNSMRGENVGQQQKHTPLHTCEQRDNDDAASGIVY